MIAVPVVRPLCHEGCYLDGPQPALVPVKVNGAHIKALVYSYYTTIAGCGVYLRCQKDYITGLAVSRGDACTTMVR